MSHQICCSKINEFLSLFVIALIYKTLCVTLKIKEQIHIQGSSLSFRRAKMPKADR